MVYLVDSWGMGDSDCAPYHKHGPKIQQHHTGFQQHQQLHEKQHLVSGVKNDRVKASRSQLAVNDVVANEKDEIAIHPLTNQVRNFILLHFNFFYCSNSKRLEIKR